jgi:AraC-like DNA-binding protein
MLLRAAIGVTPKCAARVFRFERACRLIKDERAGLAHVAASCAYFDQAHLTHEWNALAGCSPREWIARELPFLEDYELGGRDNECDDIRPSDSPLHGWHLRRYPFGVRIYSQNAGGGRRFRAFG